jgi:hypothetical protein
MQNNFDTDRDGIFLDNTVDSLLTPPISKYQNNFDNCNNIDVLRYKFLRENIHRVILRNRVIGCEEGVTTYIIDNLELSDCELKYDPKGFDVALDELMSETS